jgi:hypothetical protein
MVHSLVDKAIVIQLLTKVHPFFLRNHRVHYRVHKITPLYSSELCWEYIEDGGRTFFRKFYGIL